MWLGLAFARAAATRVKVDGPWAQPAILFVLLFIGIVRVPVTLYMYLAHPDWSWFYMVDADRVPGLALVPLVFADAALIVGGYYLGTRLVRAGKENVLHGLLAGLGVLGLLIVLVAWQRAFSYGSYEQFHSGHSLGLLEVKLGFVVIVVAVGFVTAAALVAFELWKDARRTINR